MSSATLQDLIAELPSEREAIERFADLMKVSGNRAAWTMDRLYSLIRPSSRESMVRILLMSASKGLVQTFITVESDSGGEIESFYSIDDLPPVISDWRAGGRPVPVTPENVRVYYAPQGYERRR